MKNNLMQLVRLVAMVLAVAGIIYALEFMERGIAVWFWITLLGVGFVGLLYTFRLTNGGSPCCLATFFRRSLSIENSSSSAAPPLPIGATDSASFSSSS